jgi:uncharacterized protein YcfL
MRSAILLLAVLIAGCAQSDRRTKSDTPVVMENHPLSERIRIHKQEQDQQKAAEDTTAETTVDGVVVR